MEWYESEVQALELAQAGRDAGDRPPVFYGSSSVRLWETLAEDVDPRVINLGFGGSTLEACDHFFTRLIPPARPRSLLLYAGDNDLGDGRGVDEVFGWYRSLAEKLASAAGPIPFGFLSIKPSPARWGIIERIRRLNEMVRLDIGERTSGYYVDVYSAMLDREGGPRAELFQADGLHLSREGYRLWSRLLEPHRNQICIQ